MHKATAKKSLSLSAAHSLIARCRKRCAYERKYGTLTTEIREVDKELLPKAQ